MFLTRLSKVRPILALCIIALPIAISAQAVTLKRIVKVGDTAKYRTTFVFTVYGNDVFYTSTETDKVTAVNKDGSYVIESSQTDVHANSGNDLPVKQNPAKSYTTYDARGRVLDLSGAQPGTEWRDANLGSFILPEKPINKGDTWTVNLDARADRLTPGATFIFTDDGFSVDKGDDSAGLLKIEEKYTENTPGNPATSTGTIWVNPADGSIVKVDETWNFAPLLGLTTLVNGHVSYQLIP
ncbi:MAG TPA: hypothetical protein VGL56_16835 [Fimbriimonadaceae bacterium]|jgi:hypothetical protein